MSCFVLMLCLLLLVGCFYLGLLCLFVCFVFIVDWLGAIVAVYLRDWFDVWLF